MRVFLKKRIHGQIEFGIIYGGIAVLALLAGQFVPGLSSAMPPCWFKGFLGIPCPTCGSTRSLVGLSQGNIAASLTINPLISFAVIFAVIYFVYSLITFIFDLPRVAFSPSEKEKDAARAGAVILALTNWVYLFITL